MKKLFLIVLLYQMLIACNHQEEKSANKISNDSIPPSSNYSLSVNQDSVTQDNSRNNITPGANQQMKTHPDARMNAGKIEVVVYRNKDIPGYGYDIVIDGNPKIHQPHIPAVPGNNGFKTEEDAKKTGELAKQKILNNVMPPTIDVRELDSLGIK
jgi:hypothetical protein